ncbi:MAG TPA: prepilin-type N-terminal cleavage/methylation domain-containing protein [Gammaproteobacteria bacterium]|nr:prepilin-type N-terminal cleavage/methylation domain-containing protein [Gammaproteobacteria bacterium]
MTALARIRNRESRIPIFQSGFTLIEIIVVIIVLGILGAASTIFVNYAVEGYAAQTRRARLVDETTLVLSRMARDIRSALPNSVRVTSNGSRVAIEMINVAAGARYRDAPGPSHSGSDAILKFNRADDRFNVLPAISDTLPAGTRLVIYNVGISGADAYENVNVITPATTTVTTTADGNETQVSLSAGFQFQYRSPNQRIYFVDGPISYVCDTTANTLKRYSGYPIGNPQPVADADFGGTSGALAARDVAGCDFTYQAGTTQRGGVATLSLTLTRRGESVHLLEQVHVVNAP